MHALVPHLAIAVPLQHERSTLLVSSDDVSSRALTPLAFADGSIYANITQGMHLALTPTVPTAITDLLVFLPGTASNCTAATYYTSNYWGVLSLAGERINTLCLAWRQPDARVHVDGRRAAATRPHSHLVARSGPLIVLLGHEDSGPLLRMSCR